MGPVGGVRMKLSSSDPLDLLLFEWTIETPSFPARCDSAACSSPNLASASAAATDGDKGNLKLSGFGVHPQLSLRFSSSPAD